MNSATIKISVLIPVYNVEKTLKRCLDSAICQTFKEIEIICVNDGSTDCSGSILRSYAALDSRIRILTHDMNKGLFLARKTAVSAAVGKYIMFLDSDDALLPDACKIAYEAIEKHQVQICHFGTVVIPGEKTPSCQLRKMKKYLPPFAGLRSGVNVFPFQKETADVVYSITLWSKIFQTSLCQTAYALIPDFHLVVAEDLLAYFVISLLADRYYAIPSKKIYCYYLGRGICSGDSHQLTDQQFEEYCRTSVIADVLSEILSQLPHPATFEKVPGMIRAYLLHECFERYVPNISEKKKQMMIKYYFDGSEKQFLQCLELFFMIQKYEKSLSVKLGLFLTKIPRRIFSRLTGRKY